MIAVYTTRNSSIKLFEKLKNIGIPAKIINTPRELYLGCGLSVAFRECDFNRVRTIVNGVSRQSFAGIWRESAGVFMRIY